MTSPEEDEGADSDVVVVEDHQVLQQKVYDIEDDEDNTYLQTLRTGECVV